MKINQKVAAAVGPGYSYYMKKIFGDMLHMYNLYSQCISFAVQNRQEPMMKPMKAARRDMLKLI